jgi:hypothetical protein
VVSVSGFEAGNAVLSFVADLDATKIRSYVAVWQIQDITAYTLIKTRYWIFTVDSSCKFVKLEGESANLRVSESDSLNSLFLLTDGASHSVLRYYLSDVPSVFYDEYAYPCAYDLTFEDITAVEDKVNDMEYTIDADTGQVNV